MYQLFNFDDYRCYGGLISTIIRVSRKKLNSPPQFAILENSPTCFYQNLRQQSFVTHFNTFINLRYRASNLRILLNIVLGDCYMTNVYFTLRPLEDPVKYLWKNNYCYLDNIFTMWTEYGECNETVF